MADAVAIHYRASSSSRFGGLAPDMPVIRITIDPADIDQDDTIRAFDVATNLGADLSQVDGMRAVGHVLHRLAHALLSTNGVIVDMSDIELAPEQQPGGAS